MLSLVPSIIALGAAALVAFGLTRSRTSPDENGPARLRASRVLALATGVQSIHFVEEAATGFHERFGAVFGVPAMPLWFFLTFNLAWIGIWIASIPGLRAGRTGAFFAAWFLAVAGALNGIAHPLLALRSGGYFPGLISSPFICAAAVVLWRQLQAATEPA